MKKLFILIVALGIYYGYSKTQVTPPQKDVVEKEKSEKFSALKNQFTALATIEGMTCEGCSNYLTGKLKDISGVTSVDVNHQTGQAHLASDELIDLDALSKLITDLGYTCQATKMLGVPAATN